MNKLPLDFEMDKYGLHVRFVNEDDAEFILKLRTDPELSKFIHNTEYNVENQKEWIRNYKIRENKGSEYYFIFYFNGKPVGLNRIYAIKEDGSFTTGSWIFAKDAPIEASVASAIIVREIAFDVLDMLFENAFDGCHVDNKKVLRFNKMLGLRITGEIQDEKGKYYTQSLDKEDFLMNKAKILHLINCK